ncbi:MAG: hypothetical protein V7L22_08635 [Nostoc sp.]|uniref:hypothetical protein n=1 Tax=Nostoc sp. TaxID=1180 RepID=UPI002FFC94A8
MPNNNGSGLEPISPLLVILVAGSISLAIVNKANHLAYFDIVKIAMAYSFGSIKSQGKTKHSNHQDEVDQDEKSLQTRTEDCVYHPNISDRSNFCQYVRIQMRHLSKESM